MKNLQSISSWIFILFIATFSGCETEPCIDVDLFNSRTQITKEWILKGEAINRTLVDKHGISQTLIPLHQYFYEVVDVVEDACGNNFTSLDFSIQYNTSMSRIYFLIDIRSYPIPEDDFEFSIMVTQANSVREATYNFIRETSTDKNATFELLKEVQINNTTYAEVLKIDFLENESPTAITTVYYAKNYGIVKLVDNSGNNFEVTE